MATYYANDADIEMAQLEGGWFDDEPPCPVCGAEDPFVSRFSNAERDAEVDRVAERAGMRRSDVTTCSECLATFDNRGGRGFRRLDLLVGEAGETEVGVVLFVVALTLFAVLYWPLAMVLVG